MDQALRVWRAFLLCLAGWAGAAAAVGSPPFAPHPAAYAIPIQSIIIPLPKFFPYAAKVVSHSGSHMCMGVLISPNEVLVLAQCIKSAIFEGGPFPAVTVHGQIETVCRIEYFHDKPSSMCGEDGLAVLTLNRAAALGTPISALDSRSQAISTRSNGKFVTLGWFANCIGSCGLCGKPAQFLQVQNVRVEHRETCRKLYGNAFRSSSLMCAASDLSVLCNWDLGQALVYIDPATERHTLVGMGAFGKQPEAGCNTATVFVRVDKYVRWIQNRRRLTRRTKVKYSPYC